MRLSALLFALIFALNLSAESKFTRFFVKLDSVMEAKYYKVNYDTNYIGRPDFRWIVSSRANLSGHNLVARGSESNMNAESDLRTDLKATLKLAVTYYGITAGFALNPAKWAGKNKDFEINANFYNNRYSIDLSYQSSETLRGDLELRGRDIRIDKGDAKLKSLNLTADYIFNYKKFSMPAAFTQSFVQKKSAGSWMVGLSFQASSITADEQQEKLIRNTDIALYRVSLGGGYGYNIVAGRWLIHLSATPTIVVYNYGRLTLDEFERKRGVTFPDMIFTERAAVTWHINRRVFLGANAVLNHSLMRDNDIYFGHYKWITRLVVGVRLSDLSHKKKHNYDQNSD